MDQNLSVIYWAIAIIGLIGLLFFPIGLTSWMWVLFILVVSYSIWSTPRYLRDHYAREQKELKTIRERLLEIEQ